jgi:hypothetical protein
MTPPSRSSDLSTDGAWLAIFHNAPSAAASTPLYFCESCCGTNVRAAQRLCRNEETRLDTVSAEALIVMNAVFALLAVSAIAGLVLGLYFSWVAILASGLVLAFVSAMVLQKEGFEVLAGIAIIVVCLTVNQVAYLIGVRLVTRRTQGR